LSDGELYNRIFCGTTFKVTNGKTEAIVNLEDIRQKINDIKKQFPDVKRELEFPNKYIKVLTSKDYEDIIKLFYDWCNKWLGD
jgi:hypothetical protein